MGDCLTEYNIYWGGVIGSILLTLVVIGYAKSKKDFADDPQSGVKFYRIFAGVKVVLGILLLTVLFPSDCAGFHSFYGFVAILIGLLWLNRARGLSGRASESITEIPTITSGEKGQEIV